VVQGTESLIISTGCDLDLDLQRAREFRCIATLAAIYSVHLFDLSVQQEQEHVTASSAASQQERLSETAESADAHMTVIQLEPSSLFRVEQRCHNYFTLYG